MKRLSVSGSVMCTPHVLSDQAAVLHFHRCMILHCLQHKLPHLLAFYLDYYRLVNSAIQWAGLMSLQNVGFWFGCGYRSAVVQ